MAESLLAFENVRFSYTQKQKLLDNVSFSIYPGDVVCLIGKNGSGKSTIARLILGLEHPQQGTISVLNASPQEVRTQIAYLPQYTHFDPLFPVTAMDIVLMGMPGSIFGRLRKDDKEKARAALRSVNLDMQADHAFPSFSGGERQRILIARALADDNWRILLMDEPSAHVDKEFQQVLEKLLANCPKDRAILCISHDIDFVSSLPVRILNVHTQVSEYSNSTG